MKHLPVLAFLGFTIGLYLSGCAGGAPPADLGLMERTSESAIPILLQETLQEQWVRPIQPESNSTFTTINGNPYYRLGPGDVLELTINLDNGANQFPLVISPDGYIQLPATLGSERVHIAGLAVPQAEERLSAALSGMLRRPFPILRVSLYQYAFVTLIGEITHRGADPTTGEGRFALTGRTTLLDFVLTHSSFTDETDITAVIVTDAEGRSRMFDLSATIYSADQSHNPVLDRGDTVTIPSLADTRRYIYVLGEVEMPILLPPTPGMTVLDAISEAGGPNERARQRWVTLVQGRGQDAEKYQIPYNKILKEGDLTWNVPLAPGDIVYVSRSPYNTTVQFFRDIWAVLQSAVVISILVERFK